MLDDSLIPPATPQPQPPLWKRVRAWTIVVGMYALILGMVCLATALLYWATKPGVAFDDRMLRLLIAAGLLVFPGKVASEFIKRTRVTGSVFVMTEEEKARIAARRSAMQCGTAQSGALGRPFTFLSCWAGYFAWDRSAGLWQRILAWALILLYSAWVLFLIGFGVVCIGASFADGVRQPLILILFGLALFIYPALAIRSHIRRFRTTGTLRVSREELQSATARRAELQNKQRQRPLRSKIISYLIGLPVLAPAWMRATVYHSRHPYDSWFLPALFTISLLYSAWRDFSKPQQTQYPSSDSF